MIKFIIFAPNTNKKEMNKEKLNRIKAALAEAERTNKWLAEQLGKDSTTVSKWCTNTIQPDLQTLSKIAHLLDINIKDLIINTK